MRSTPPFQYSRERCRWICCHAISFQVFWEVSLYKYIQLNSFSLKILSSRHQKDQRHFYTMLNFNRGFSIFKLIITLNMSPVRNFGMSTIQYNDYFNKSRQRKNLLKLHFKFNWNSYYYKKSDAWKWYIVHKKFKMRPLPPRRGRCIALTAKNWFLFEKFLTSLLRSHDITETY